ncbi:uncharacterized protein LOC125049535 [Pieris napi]|uniref:uncharacterized protein LOC125049535 n=1 Tax=Pieris napi TaxID=78633 RepID=UPI001FBB26B1|nr:uncharacterized protein LOC125049535 [Pieris napi]
MGDLIELSAIPRHENIFYKFTGNCLQFAIKSSRNAKIGLADYPRNSRITWVILGEHSGIEEYGYKICQTPTPNLLTHNKYKKFCLAWFGNKVELFSFGTTIPIFSYEINNRQLKYVTFCQWNNESLISWKFVSPPNIERPILKPINGGMTYWVPYDGILPYGALIGGFENEFLYIMRAPHEGSLTPGKYVPSLRCGFVAWGSESHLKHEMEILCGLNCLWLSTTSNVIPSGAIPGGYTEYEGREIMYIGRAFRDGHIIPGKVAPSHKVCYFAYKEDTAYENNYEILVAPYSNPRFINSNTTPIMKCEDTDQNLPDDWGA